MDPATKEELVTRLLALVWGQDPPGVDKAILKQVAADLAIPFEASEADAAKRKLRENGEEAIAKGIFGVPTVAVSAEIKFFIF